MCQVASSYFTGLFDRVDVVYDPVLSKAQARITDDDNMQLIKPFEEDEFKVAISQMHPDKSLGPDGLHLAFYQRFWELYGKDIYLADCSWLCECCFPPNLNDTNIVLIPKCDDPKCMKDLRPISLYNVLYKIVSKVLANRIRRVISKCISEEQSAFVEGHSILDNALIAIEVVHYMKCKTKGKKGDVALKIHITKARDRIDWNYMRGMMYKLGFNSIWVDWIMMCVESVVYQVQVNSEQVGPIFPTRGLRQGDPLSPYLFILCAKDLTALIKYAQARGNIHGVAICRGASVITHLLFADDCFFFFQANDMEMGVMKNNLQIYAAASGQEVNYSKFEVFLAGMFWMM